jgi:hypothetical protein
VGVRGGGSYGDETSFCEGSVLRRRGNDVALGNARYRVA